MSEEELIPITVKIPEDTLKELDKIADNQQRNRSNLLNVIIAAYVEKNKVKP